MSKNSILVAALLCASAAFNGVAQEMSMDLQDVLSRVGANADVRSAQSRYEASRQGIAVAESNRLPRVEASLDLNYLGDGTILDRDFSNAMRDRLPHFGNTLSVNLYQPVYQGGAINAGIDLARQQSELAAIGVEQSTESVGIEAVATYLNLLKMNNLRQVYLENIAITERLIAQMTEHFNQGTALRNDITRYELRLSSLRYDLQCIDNSISVLNNNLTSLLCMDPGVTIIPSLTVDYESLNMGDEAYWQALTADNSTDLRAIDKSQEIAGTGLRLEKAAMLPSVGIIVGDQLTGPITFEIPTLNKNYNAWFAGVTIHYDISSLWTSNKKIKQRRLEMVTIDDQRVARSEALSRKVHEAFTAATQARQMLDTETVNVRLATENYTIVETRFHNDMALLTDMLDASTAKLDAETRLVNARINLLLAYYQLKFISGTLTTTSAAL